MLQILVELTFCPENHPALISAGVEDALLQLVLPSDELFYTNQTIACARVIKHHAARCLVYLGLQSRIQHRAHIFDLLNGKYRNTRNNNKK